MIKPIDFTTSSEFQVELTDDALGSLGPGVLRLKPGSWPHITFSPFSHPMLIAQGTKRTILRAETADGLCFTLINCKAHLFSVSVDYVIAGSVDGPFKAFEVRYRDITDWYSPWRALKEDADHQTYRWDSTPTHIDATVTTTQETFRITTRYDSSVETNGEDHIIHEHILFCFTAVGGNFLIEDIETKATELSRLLSILLAFPISIVSIHAVGQNDFRYSVIFPEPKHIDKRPPGTVFPHRCFVQEPMLRGQWDTVLNGYFNSAYRAASWARLAGMQRYEGFWEYKVIGYVSLLDNFVSSRYNATHRPKRIRVPISSRKKRRLAHEVGTLGLPLSTAERNDLIEHVATQLVHYRKPTFQEKFTAVVNNTEKDILAIIHFTDDDFLEIKKIRDVVAHGDTLELTDEKLKRIEPIMSKIVLLMTYWALVDIGLTDAAFIHCLEVGHSSLMLASEINTTYLDRLTKPESFFRVSEIELGKIRKLKETNPVFLCFTATRSGSLRYSKTYSDRYKAQQLRNTGRSAVTTHGAIFDVPDDQVKYYSTLYVECGDDHLALSACWVIDENSFL